MSVGKARRAQKEVCVIGGGWAGCATAVELARLGHHVVLYEAARTLGGRARCVEVDGNMLDNGQHILLGAYSEATRLLRLVGIQPDEALMRLPLQIRYPETSSGMDLRTPRFPAPFHMLLGLARARGLAFTDKMALARFTTAARWMDWQLNADCSVAELLDRFDQTDRLIQMMWRPLCIAALNTPPERASANIFLNVLRDSIGAHRAASDMLLPRVDLTSLFPERARAFVESHGGIVWAGTAVKSLQRADGRWQVMLNAAGESPATASTYDAVVVATAPGNAAALLREWTDVTHLESFAYEPITTCYLQYEPTTTLHAPFFALLDDASCGHWGQFVFDRGQLDAKQAGLLSVVVSASAEAIAIGHEALAMAIREQLADAFQRPELSVPVWTKVISEKRATFSCTPGLIRPDNRTQIDGLVIAGDYTASEYPATLESAIRSGVKAARDVFNEAV